MADIVVNAVLAALVLFAISASLGVIAGLIIVWFQKKRKKK